MKTEPDCFSLDDLQRRPAQTEAWDGVRNYQARNFMRDGMRVGDTVLFYHSNCEVPGIYGLATVASTAYPDPTQFDPTHEHYDPKSQPEEPRWLLVDVRYHRHLARPITLEQIKAHETALAGCPLVMKGNRLSVFPVRPEHAAHILAMEQAA